MPRYHATTLWVITLNILENRQVALLLEPIAAKLNIFSRFEKLHYGAAAVGDGLHLRKFMKERNFGRGNNLWTLDCEGRVISSLFFLFLTRPLSLFFCLSSIHGVFLRIRLYLGRTDVTSLSISMKCEENLPALFYQLCLFILSSVVNSISWNKH